MMLDTKYNLPQIIAILTSSFSGISLGLLFGWTSPAVPQLLDDASKSITLEQASYFTIITSASMVVASPLFSILLDVVGRRSGVLIVVIPQLISWILVFFANNIWMFYLARISAGVADAAVFSSAPVYICEVSQPKIRDIWGNMLTINIYFGAFLMNIIGAYSDIKTSAVICGIFPLLHFGVFWFMPESPYYLLMKSRENDARKALTMLRGTPEVDEELLLLKKDVARQISETSTLRDVLTVDTNRRALFICILTKFAQYFSGMPAYHTYTQYLFKEAGGNLSEKISAIIFSGCFLICTTVCVYFLGMFGKRPLLIYSSLGCGLTLGALSIYFSIRQFTDLDVSIINWLPLAGMLLYIAVSCTGINILPTLLMGEMFSASIKSKAVSVSNMALSVFEIIVPKVFQLMTSNFGIYAPFIFFSACCFLSALLCYVYVVETKGKTLEEIQQSLKRTKIYSTKL